MVGEECGVCACVLKKNNFNILPQILYILLNELQHRGQTSSGLAVYSHDSRKRLKSCSEVGKVNNLFRSYDKAFFNNFFLNNSGNSGIGHVRYATSNVNDDMLSVLEEAQPFLRRHGRPWKKFAIAFNGHITNYNSLKDDLIKEGYYLDTDVDTEVLMHLISLSLKNNWNDSIDFPNGIFKVFREVIKNLDGSFSFVFLNGQGDMIIVRDKYGFRPLVIGENENMICVASESKALIKVGMEKFRDVYPGEIILIRDGKIYSFIEGCSCSKAYCHFEYVYFSDACSVNNGIIVDEVRGSLGKILAREEKIKFNNPSEWVVVPVPSTGIPIAVAYAQNSKLPLSFALIKSDVGRGFINSSFQRKIIMDSKYNIVPRSVLGKKVILIDDSIVRGETSSRVIELLRIFGAKEVHLRVGEMPIKYPCCYGVDFPSFEELILGNFKGTKEEAEKIVAQKIHADSVGFVSFDGLKESLGGKNNFCFACLNGDYPTKAGCGFLEGKLKKLKERNNNDCIVED